MHNRKWFKYLLHVLLIYSFLFSNAYIISYLNDYVKRTFDNPPGAFLYGVLIYIIFGALLGLESLISQFKQFGCWKIDYKKALIFGLPALFFRFILISIFLYLL